MAEGYESYLQGLAASGVPMNAGNMSRAMSVMPQVVPVGVPIMPGVQGAGLPAMTPQAAPAAAPRVPRPSGAAAAMPAGYGGQSIPEPPPVPPGEGGEAPLSPGYEDTLIPGQQGAAPMQQPQDTPGFFDWMYDAIAGVPAPVWGALALAGGAAGVNAMSRASRGAAPAATGPTAVTQRQKLAALKTQGSNITAGEPTRIGTQNMPNASATAPSVSPNTTGRFGETPTDASRPAFGKKVVTRAEQSMPGGQPMPQPFTPEAVVADYIMQGVPQRSMMGIPGQGATGMPYPPGPQVGNVRMGGVAPAVPQPNVMMGATPDTWIPQGNTPLSPPQAAMPVPGASIQGGAIPGARPPAASPTGAMGMASPSSFDAVLDDIMRNSPQPPQQAAPKPKPQPKKDDRKGGMTAAEAARRKSNKE